MQTDRLRFAFGNRESDAGAKDDDDYILFCFALPSSWCSSHRRKSVALLSLPSELLLNSLRGANNEHEERVARPEYGVRMRVRRRDEDARLNRRVGFSEHTHDVYFVYIF